MANYQFVEVPTPLKGTAERKESIKSFVPSLLGQAFGITQCNATVYHMKGRQDDYNIEEGNFKIFANHGFSGSGEIKALENVTLNGITLASQVYLPASNQDNKILMSDTGVPLVEVNPSRHQAVILFDVFNPEQEKVEELFKAIMEFIHNAYVKPLVIMYSWKFSETKDELTKQVAVVMKKERDTQIKNLESNIKSAEQYIRDYTQKITNQHRQLILNREQVIGLREGNITVENTFCKDLDLVSAHPKVEDLQIKNGIFHVFTKELIMTHDKTGELYFLGKMRLEINPQNSSVKFINLTQQRQGYWGSRCHHPHVNETGGACLGNASSTIAELCAQMQFYPLVLFLIEYCQSVNTDDGAGRTISNWDRCDKDGKIIKKAGR